MLGSHRRRRLSTKKTSLIQKRLRQASVQCGKCAGRVRAVCGQCACSVRAVCVQKAFSVQHTSILQAYCMYRMRAVRLHTTYLAEYMQRIVEFMQCTSSLPCVAHSVRAVCVRCVYTVQCACIMRTVCLPYACSVLAVYVQCA